MDVSDGTANLFVDFFLYLLKHFFQFKSHMRSRKNKIFGLLNKNED